MAAAASRQGTARGTWSGYAGIEMLVKWAYIKDLLPKGGKE